MVQADVAPAEDPAVLRSNNHCTADKRVISLSTRASEKDIGTQDSIMRDESPSEPSPSPRGWDVRNRSLESAWVLACLGPSSEDDDRGRLKAVAGRPLPS